MRGAESPHPGPLPQGNRPLSFPTFSIPPVIPDIVNRESMAFPMQSHTNEGIEEQDTGFPLTTGGNDRGGGAGGMTEGVRACMTEGPGGKDKGPEQA